MPDDTTAIDSSKLAQSRPPRAQRTSVMLTATILSGEGDQATRHRVRDISSRGLRIDNAGGLRPGATVSISLGSLQDIPATVHWTRAGFAGLAFAEEINLKDAHKRAGSAPTARDTQNAAETPVTIPEPTAGWIGEMRNPYRK
jgi:hypothetical protein